MCNKIGMARRGLTSIRSWPARLHGYALLFTLGGMATVEPHPGGTVHGVLHVISESDLAALREIEVGCQSIAVFDKKMRTGINRCAGHDGGHDVGGGGVSHGISAARGCCRCREQVYEDPPLVSQDLGLTARVHKEDLPPGGPAKSLPPVARQDPVPSTAPENLLPITADQIPTSMMNLSEPVTEELPLFTGSKGVPPGGATVDLPPVTALTFRYSQSVPPSQRALPSERYIRIISAGCEDVGVDPGWVSWLRSVPVEKERDETDWLRLGALPRCPVVRCPAYRRWTMAEVEECAGKELVFVMGYGPRTVLRVAPMGDDATNLMRRMAWRIFSGKDITFSVCRNLYEPLLPDAPSPAELLPVHYRWVENFVLGAWWDHFRLGGEVTLLGYVDDEGPLLSLSPPASPPPSSPPPTLGPVASRNIEKGGGEESRRRGGDKGAEAGMRAGVASAGFLAGTTWLGVLASKWVSPVVAVVRLLSVFAVVTAAAACASSALSGDYTIMSYSMSYVLLKLELVHIYYHLNAESSLSCSEVDE
eukprot:jgi/Mesvir1/859/Mv17430-RA.1